MTSEKNKAIVRTFLGAFETNDQATFNEILSQDFVLHTPGAPGPVDRETHVEGIGLLSAAFSELKLNIENQIAESDLVATRFIWQATHIGDIWGLAPTGKHITVAAFSIERIKDDQIVERWYQQDDLGLMQQLGAMPS